MGEAGGATAKGLPGFAPALTSFIGRAVEMDEVTRLLDACRLVTVTGPGGAGKTQMAGEVASRLAGSFADGVCLAELAPVQDPARVPAAVAAALAARCSAAVGGAGLAGGIGAAPRALTRA